MKHEKPGVLAITSDQIWVQGASPSPDQILTIREGKATVQPRSGWIKNLDTLHKPGIILPGFVDCHVHLGLRAGREPSRVLADLKTLKQRGLEAVRDAGDRDGTALEASACIPDSLPVLIPCGTALRFPEAYGGFLGRSVRSTEEGVACINRLSKAGARVLKLIITGRMDFCRQGEVSGPNMDTRHIKAFTRAAHERGLKVMAHVNTDAAVREAVSGGVDSIEHGYFMEADTLDILAGKGVAWVPTLIPLWHLEQQEGRADVKACIKAALEAQLNTLAKAVEKGVLLGVGTDLGSSGLPPEMAYYRELLLYRRAGLSWNDMLRAATFNGYSILGLDHLVKPGPAASSLIHLPRDLEAFLAAGDALPGRIPH